MQLSAPLASCLYIWASVVRWVDKVACGQLEWRDLNIRIPMVLRGKDDSARHDLFESDHEFLFSLFWWWRNRFLGRPSFWHTKTDNSSSFRSLKLSVTTDLSAKCLILSTRLSNPTAHWTLKRTAAMWEQPSSTLRMVLKSEIPTSIYSTAYRAMHV